MKKIFALALAMWFALCAPALAVEPSGGAPSVSVGELVLALAAGDDDALLKAAAEPLKDALDNSGGCAAIWSQLTTSFGAFDENYTVLDVQEDSGYTIAPVVCAFQSADVTIGFVFDADGLLSGIQILSTQRRDAQPEQTDAWREEAISLRPGQADQTEGMLTLPAGEGPFPAVIMMQGSGPSDLDAGAYGLALFRDIARGLAQRGVASIRYDKYTYAHADLCGEDFTEDLEYTYDARSALEILQADARISEVFLLGHSQGAMLLPRVARDLGADSLAGGVMLSGTTLHLWQVQMSQLEDMLPTLSPKDRLLARSMLNGAADQLEELSKMSDEEQMQETFFGISAYYQLDDISVEPADTALENGIPLFIAQGGKDWQVPPELGIDLWREALADFSDATYALYPDMNHMLFDMEGEATGTSADYEDGKPVSETMIGDIAQWILAQ